MAEVPPHFGDVIRRAREARGLGRAALARQLNLPPAFLEALETGDWESLPPGRERPLARQVAERLAVDPAEHAEAWSNLPGELLEDAPDPRRDRLEQVVMGGLTLGSIVMLGWLLVPGPSLKGRGLAAPTPEIHPSIPAVALRVPDQPYPVLGEALPEAPRTAEGVLVVLRALDHCEARIQGDGIDVRRTLQVSEPWKLRVKGAFILAIENAGVVAVEVAGRGVRHGQSVGERWTGSFDADGAWQRPRPPEEGVPTRPEIETEE